MTNRQNNAFHKFCELIAIEYNEIGLSMNNIEFANLDFNIRFDKDIVKKQIVKKIIKQYWDLESTQDLDNYKLNQIIDMFNLHFAQIGRKVYFPSIETLMFKLDKE